MEKIYKPKAGELPKRCSKCTGFIVITNWQLLQFVGYQHVPAGEDATKEPAYTLEMRNCTCGTTLSIEVVEVN